MSDHDASYNEADHLEEELFNTVTLLQFHSNMERDQMGQLEEVELQERFHDCHNHRERVSISESIWFSSLTKTVNRLEQLACLWMQLLKAFT